MLGSGGFDHSAVCGLRQHGRMLCTLVDEGSVHGETPFLSGKVKEDFFTGSSYTQSLSIPLHQIL